VSLIDYKYLYEGFNLLPMRSDITAPAVKSYREYQNKLYPQEKIDYSKNLCVMLGGISGNLIDLELDLPKEFKENNTLTSDQTDEIYDWITDIFPFIKDTLTIKTKSGSLRFLIRVIDYDKFFSLDNKDLYKVEVNKEFDGFTIEHIELRGKSHISALAPSSMDNGKGYSVYNEIPIRKLTHAHIKVVLIRYKYFNGRLPDKKEKNSDQKIEPMMIDTYGGSPAVQKKEYPFQDPIIDCSEHSQIRKGWLWLLEGRMEIKKYKDHHKKQEHVYWQHLWAEIRDNTELKLEDFLKIISVTQKSEYKQEKWVDEQREKVKSAKPMSSKLMKEYFPDIEKCTKKEKKQKRKTEVMAIFEIADLILSEIYIKTIEESGEMLLYGNGTYKRNKRRAIRKIITEKLREIEQDYSKKKENDILSLIGNLTLISIKEFDKDPYILNIDNGLLNILTEKIRDHDPEYLSFRRIPLIYNPDMACPLIDAFFGDIFHKEDISFIEEYVSLCLTPIMDFQRALLLQGKGNNGKTTFLNLVQLIIGELNSSNIDISKFENDSVFAQIENKLINVVPDIDTETKINIQRFKDYVGNALLILINKKYKDPYSIHPTAKLIYSCNSTYPEIPSGTDKGFWRKWIFIECPRSLDKIEIRDKLSELINENEFSGFLNKTIKAFQRLHQRGMFEEQYNSWELIKDTWIENKNVVQEFIKEKCSEDPTSYVIQKEFVNKLNEWLKEKGRIPLYSGTITRKINSNPLYEQSRKRIGGVRTHIYKGFGFSKNNRAPNRLM